jgi:tetratricopeptide (TPR) repeat protein
LLFAAFSYLSLQATRNSHQFAAVVGTVTAWNFGEWAAAIRRRKAERRGSDARPATVIATQMPRIIAAGTIVAVLAWVGSGVFYRMTGEGRTIGLGEEPLFFPHEAVRFAGRPEMPERFLSFHNGHASLFMYYHGPGRKVFTDPRLEVAGPDLFAQYTKLDKNIRGNTGGWQGEMDRIGRPVVLVDHTHNWENGATLLGDDHWKCVWFDPIVAVFVHDSAAEAVRQHAVDFAARHFRPDPGGRTQTLIERIALAKTFRYYVTKIPSLRTDLIWPLVWLGEDNCRGILREVPDSAVGWRMLGQIEIARDPALAHLPSPRYRLPFDPVADLSLVRSTYALRRGLELDPDDLTTLMRLDEAYTRRGMNEAALGVLDRIATLAARHPLGEAILGEVEPKRASHRRELGAPPSTTWRNMAELDRLVTALLATGRAATAANILEQANSPERSSWDVLDRMAVLRLHLGEPTRARALWQRGMGAAPDPAVAAARIGATYLAEGDFEAARRAYRRALAAKPGLFEASYGLAVLEQDAGDAAAAYDLAQKAAAGAPDDRSRDAARMIAAAVERFAARPTGAATAQTTPKSGKEPGMRPSA